jgi:hypothetical protein
MLELPVGCDWIHRGARPKQVAIKTWPGYIYRPGPLLLGLGIIFSLGISFLNAGEQVTTICTC